MRPSVGLKNRQQIMSQDVRIAIGFDMQTELAKLAERIVEPVAAKLSMQEFGNVVSQIKQAFEQLNTSAPGLTPISKIWPLPSLGQFSRC
jgi:hypothetical protein